MNEAVATPKRTARFVAASGANDRHPLQLRIDSAAPVLAGALLLGALYAIGALLPFWFVENPALGAAFFPSAGLTLAALLIAPRRAWPALLGAVAVAEVSVDMWHGQAFWMAAGFAAANVAEPYVGANLLRTVRPRPESTSYEFARFLGCGVVVAPLVGGAIGGAVAAASGQGAFWSIAGKWWLGDAVGVLVVATPILAWTNRRQYQLSAKAGEIVALAAVALAIILVPTMAWQTSVAFAVLPVLIWAALRAGPLGVASTGLVASFAVDWIFVTGRADRFLAVGAKNHALIDVQLFLATTLLAAYVLAIEVGERVQAERQLLRSERARARVELTARDLAAAERRRIARETHDIVGHALNVMLLSAGAARRSIDADPDAALTMIENVEEVGREAFGDLDVALGLMDHSRDIADHHGIADLEELIDHVRRAGLDVDFRLAGTPRNVPTLIDWSVYRIVQECLTNALQHADGAHTVVDLRFQPALIIVAIENDSSAKTIARERAHYGLTGMRERVEVVGGRFSAGARTEGGFAVLAELPYAG